MIEGLLLTTIKDLNLSLTLRSGQTFRWRLRGDQWLGIIGEYVFGLKQNSNSIQFKVFNEDLNSNLKNDFFIQLLKHYFRLDFDLSHAYDLWSRNDDHFRRIADDFRGIRVLRQEPMETLFSFICSSNNNILRISQMIEKMCQKFGQKVLLSEDLEEEFHSFPDIRSLAEEGVEEELKLLGFGYRSKYIEKTAKIICSKHPKTPEEWVQEVQTMSYLKARQELMSLSGVGPKVADCIALFGFGYLEAIPVDTHVWQLSADQYLPNLKRTKKSYHEIGDLFRRKFGPFAGWTHSVLFTAHLLAPSLEK